MQRLSCWSEGVPVPTLALAQSVVPVRRVGHGLFECPGATQGWRREGDVRDRSASPWTVVRRFPQSDSRYWPQPALDLPSQRNGHAVAAGLREVSKNSHQSEVDGHQWVCCNITVMMRRGKQTRGRRRGNVTCRNAKSLDPPRLH